MKKSFIAIIATIITFGAAAQHTDAFIKLRDEKKTHPRIVGLTFPGDADRLQMYNSIYGHGAVIENPWVAYRIYMDNRQSLDLYVKASPRLELDETNFYTTPEQLEKGYGCDVLWAGKSIAAGSFRGYQNGEPVTIDTVAFRRQFVVNDHTVSVYDKEWIFNGHPINMSQTYSMNPYCRDLFVEVKLEGYTPDDMFCTGIQKLENLNQGFLLPEGVAASWGSNVPDKNHPELVEQVGLGIVVDPDNVVGVEESDLNYLIHVKPDKNGIIRYKVIACGDREADGFKDPAKWFEHVKSQK